MSRWGIVVAAGTGERFGGPKHDLMLAGRPLWEWARSALLEGGADGVVVVGHVEGGVPGGERRQDSVAIGLEHVPEDAVAIAVHDASRPLASARLVAQLFERLHVSNVDGVVPVLPLRDTVKRVDGTRVAGTIDRDTIVAVQTPQVFRAEALRRAHRSLTADVTDDAAMVEALGGTVGTVPGERAAMKITYPEDVLLAEHFIHVEGGR